MNLHNLFGFKGDKNRLSNQLNDNLPDDLEVTLDSEDISKDVGRMNGRQNETGKCLVSCTPKIRSSMNHRPKGMALTV